MVDSKPIDTYIKLLGSRRKRRELIISNDELELKILKLRESIRMLEEKDKSLSSLLKMANPDYVIDSFPLEFIESVEGRSLYPDSDIKIPMSYSDWKEFINKISIEKEGKITIDDIEYHIDYNYVAFIGTEKIGYLVYKNKCLQICRKKFGDIFK